MILVVLPSGEEDRGQVERPVSPACELSGAVICKTLDPLIPWTKVKFWVLFVLVPRYLRSVVLARHGRKQRRDRWDKSNNIKQHQTKERELEALVIPMSSSMK